MQEKQALRKKKEEPKIIDTVIEAILEKKGENTVSIDLQRLNDAVTDFFIICHGNSSSQVKAIAENVMNKVKENVDERPWHKEGFENLQWILLDYINVVVHIFLKEKRDFYQLEELWSDATVENYF